MTRETKNITNKPNANCMPTSVQIQTKSKDVIDFNIPDGEDIAEMRINGQEIHQMHELVMATEKQKKYWISLGAFLFFSTVTTLVIAIWACNRLYHLPADTAALQQVFTQTADQKFQVGNIVLNPKGSKMVVLSVNLSENGWMYRLKRLRFAGKDAGYVVASDSDYWRPQHLLGPVMFRGQNAMFDMKKIQQKVTNQLPTTLESRPS